MNVQKKQQNSKDSSIKGKMNLLKFNFILWQKGVLLNKDDDKIRINTVKFYYKKRLMNDLNNYKSPKMKSLFLVAILLLIIYPASTAYSPPLALQLGYLSAASYESVPNILAWNCTYCRKYNVTDIKVFTNSVGGIQGFTGYCHNLMSIVVVFRGSSNIQNWILNIGTTRSTYPLCSGCSVHTGFYDGYSLVASAVRSTVQALKSKYRGQKIMVTGHSLGGALAILATADLQKIFGPIDFTYTFGQPRVGNQAFADWFQASHPNVYRLVDYADVVPHVPPMNFGFVHSNVQAWYQRGMQTYQICSAESDSCANSISTTSFSTDDHSLDNYLKLKAITENISLINKLQESAITFINSHLRRQITFSQEAADEEIRKLNDIYGLFGKEFKQEKN